MRQQHLLLLAALAIATTSTACSVLVDGALQDRDSGVGIDVNVFVPTEFCEMSGVNDGERCTIEGSPDLRICNEMRCALSTCGDGLVDARVNEDCDEDDDVSGDGCEPDCTFSCTTASDCDDSNVCTDDTCGADHICSNAPNTAMCMLLGTSAMCAGGVCPLGCGNGRVDADETCDDGNAVGGDGCERDCTPSCTMDSDCEDGVACNGVATCGPVGTPGPGARQCVAGAPAACPDDGNACTTERCEDGVGCVSDGSANDVDADGSYARSCGGNDCDDTNAMINPSQAEVCGNRVDDDCNSMTSDNTQTAYFVDCDRDGFATSMAGSMSVCTPPAGVPASCAGGRWTTLSPLNMATTDCNGDNSEVNPRETRYFTTAITGATSARDFDYNCDGRETPQYSATVADLCILTRDGCSGATYYTTAPVCGAANRVSRCITFGSACVRTSASSTVACR